MYKHRILNKKLSPMKFQFWALSLRDCDSGLKKHTHAPYGFVCVRLRVFGGLRPFLLFPASRELATRETHALRISIYNSSHTHTTHTNFSFFFFLSSPVKFVTSWNS